MLEGHIDSSAATHRQPDQHGLLDLERIEQGYDVVRETVRTVCIGGVAVTAGIGSEHVSLMEAAQPRGQHAVVHRTAVEEDERRSRRSSPVSMS